MRAAEIDMKPDGSAGIFGDQEQKKSTSRYLMEIVGHTGVAAAVITVLTVPNIFLLHLIGYRSVAIIYLLGITCLSLFLNTASVVIVAVVSALLWIYLFIPPRFAILGASLEDTLMFVMYVISAFVTGVLTSRLKSSQRMLAQRERRMEFLHDFTRALSEETDLGKIAAMSRERISTYFGGDAVILLRAENGDLSPVPPCPQQPLDPDELAAARQCFSCGKPANRYTGTPVTERFHFVPLATPDTVVGVFGISIPGGKPWDANHKNYLSTLVRALSISLERETLHNEHQKRLIEGESERLGKILLNSVSHEMRTPLTAIQGAATSLLDEGGPADPELRSALLSEVLDASVRLNSIVENLLSMNRLESGHLKLKRSTVDVEELLSVALASVRTESAGHPVRMLGTISGQAVSVDFVLIVQVFSNIFQNAFRHTPDGTPIDVSVRCEGQELHAEIRDWGPGVSERELPRLFEKFYRGEKARGGGTGLGLSICAGIVQAHGGEIKAYLPKDVGFAVSFRIPHCLAEES